MTTPHGVARVLASLLVVLLVAPATAAPPNDDCANATVVNGFHLSELVDTTTATTEAGDPPLSCTIGGPSQNGHSIWYSFTAPSNGFLIFGTLGSDYDTVIGVFLGSCGSLTETGCNDDFFSDGTSSRATFVQSGVTYLLESTARDPSPGGNGRATIFFEPDSPACPSAGGPIFGGKLKLKKLGPPLGDEILVVRGEFGVSAPPDMAQLGAQVRLDDPNDDYAPLFELSSLTIPVPPGAPGSGCDPRDGWRGRVGGTFKYSNHSNALPPSCTAGSANGLTTLIVHPLRGGTGVRIKIVVRDGSIPDPLDAPIPMPRVSVGVGVGSGDPIQYGCGVRDLACQRVGTGTVICQL